MMTKKEARSNHFALNLKFAEEKHAKRIGNLIVKSLHLAMVGNDTSSQ